MRENPLVRFFVERPVLTTAFFLAVTLFGLLTAFRLGVDMLPKIEVPVVTVTTIYPGSSPREIADQVSKPVEDALSTLSGVDRIASISLEGASQVIVQFDYGVDVNVAAVDVSERVSAIRGELPADADPPVVAKFDPAADPILFVALTAPGESLGRLGAYAEDRLKPELQRIRGVADVQVVGSPDEEVAVLLQPSRLAVLGLSPLQVVQALAADTVNLPAGALDVRGEHRVVSLRSRPATPHDVAERTVDARRGLKVRDVAKVRLQEGRAETFSRLNGDPVVLMTVRKASGSNVVEVARRVHETVAALQLPEGYRLRTVFGVTRFTRATVNDTFVESLMTALIVSVIILVFLGRTNSALSVILAIPVTLAGSIVVYGVLGFTFNVISLLALIVAVGLVVDDAIVVAENIDRWLEQGYGRMEAVLRGASEVSTAVLATTLSLLAVFVPISFLPGIVGQLFREFGIGLSTAIAISYLEAMFFLTVRLAYFPDPKPPGWRDLGRLLRSFHLDLGAWRAALGRWGFWAAALALAYGGYRLSGAALPAALAGAGFALGYPLLRYAARMLGGALGALMRAAHEAVDLPFARLQDGYARLVQRLLQHSGLVLLGALALMASVAWVLPRLPFNFTPKADSGFIEITLTLPKGTDLDTTNALVQRLEGYLLTRPEVDALVTTVGASQNAGTGSAPERASLSLQLVPKDERMDQYALAEVLRRDLQARVAAHPEAKVRVQPITGGPPSAADIEFVLTAPSEARLEELNREALRLIRSLPFVRDAKSSLSERTQEYSFRLDAAKLTGTGLSALDVGRTLRAYLTGLEAGRLSDGGRDTPVVVRADPAALASVQQLLALPIAAPALGSTVPLSGLGRFERRDQAASIGRTNQAYSAGYQVNLVDPEAGALQAEQRLKRALAEAGLLGGGVGYLATGTTTFTGDLAATAPLAFLLALVLNYLVIASQFNSFRYPVYLLLPVPLALVGAFWLSYFMGTGLDVISILGTVMMVGLVTKNAILLLDFAVERARTMPLDRALVEAARLRLRPILMTSLTILVVSLPLLLGLGEGSEFRIPLGVIILGGIFSSTLLTLFVIPVAFYRYERRRYAQMQAEQ
ncbi:efflux RND transporter permease subunit [Oceanithermus sp.]|uniref:efflux RND transporter permease subunit n=1 Tax=Oceanithermus sp. TaxID=2268145 RepID=UPI0025810EC4|nr:efflux RND transporter permease subunit [Oceanithermus sp.]